MSKPCKRCNKRHLCSKKKSKPRSTKNEETAKIREAVMARAVTDEGESRCEFCWAGEAEEMHHLEGGSGRKALQAVENCVGICRACHRNYHRHPEAYRATVLHWAAKHGYPVPRRFRRPPKRITVDAATAAEKEAS